MRQLLLSLLVGLWAGLCLGAPVERASYSVSSTPVEGAEAASTGPDAALESPQASRPELARVSAPGECSEPRRIWPLLVQWKLAPESSLPPGPTNSLPSDPSVPASPPRFEALLEDPSSPFNPASRRFDDSSWRPVRVPGYWERDAAFAGLDGYVWYRARFFWEKQATGLDGAAPCRPVGLRLGAIDDSDATYFNGVLVGRTGEGPPRSASAAAMRRIYPLPASLFVPGWNVVAIRVYDGGGKGGIYLEPPSLNDLNILHTELPSRDLLTVFGPALFVLLGIYGLMSWLMDRRARHNLYLFGFALSIFGLQLYRSQLSLYLALSLIWLRELHWIGLYASMPSLTYFISGLFRVPVRRVPALLCNLLLGMAITSPFITRIEIRYPLFVTLGVVPIGALVLYNLVVVWRERQKFPVMGYGILLGFTVMALAVLADIVAALFLNFDPALTLPGTTLFVVMIVVWTARQHVADKRYLEQLNAKLEDRVAERTRALQESNHRLERRNEVLREFNALVSHDLRAPIRGLEAISDFLESDYGTRLDAEGNRLLVLLKQSSRQIRSLLDGLQILATEESLEAAESVSLDSVVDSVQLLLGGDLLKRGAVLKVEKPLPQVWGEHTRLVEVISNLVSNGIKYNQTEHPMVTIREATAQELLPDKVGLGEVCVAIVDNGIGIPAEYLERIFEPLFRVNSSDEFEGSGIGLAIVRKLVQGMRGRTWAVSMPGEGARFYVILPGSSAQRGSVDS